jgi:HEAT repeats
MTRTPFLGLIITVTAITAFFWLGNAWLSGLGLEKPTDTQLTTQTKGNINLAMQNPKTKEIRPYQPPKPDTLTSEPKNEATIATVNEAIADKPKLANVKTLPKPFKEENLAAISSSDEERETAASDEDIAKEAKANLPENWAEMKQAATAEPDPERRGEAIQSLSLYHNDEAVAVLTEASTIDPDPFNRAKAIQALWNSAADNMDSGNGIKGLLHKAQRDPDPIVANLATKAVADLDRLTKRRGS